MGKFVKTVLAASVLAATSQMAMADVSANIGVTSNYIWRGVTQNGDQSAVQGGIDYSSPVGIYAGTWISSANWAAGMSYEQDLYAGYSGTASGIGYDVGYIAYTYPGNTASADFNEVYISGSYNMFSAKYSLDSKNKNAYIEVAADVPLPEKYSLGLHFGSYSFDKAFDAAGDKSYTDYSVSFSKDDFILAFTNTSKNVGLGMTDATRATVSYTKSF